VMAVPAAASLVVAAAATTTSVVAAGAAMTTSETPTVDVVVDATAAGVAFEHRWKRSFGSGHSSLTLRKDWRAHYAKARTDLGLDGVRYHGLYDDDMGVVPAPGVYNFTLVDSTWDFLLAQGTHPVVELSFMPAFVANCTWHGHCKQDKIDCQGYWCTQCSGHGVGPVVNPAAPANCSSLEFWCHRARPPRTGHAWVTRGPGTVILALTGSCARVHRQPSRTRVG
jgi:hypothetical protein